MKKPLPSILPTTLWDFPSQHYGDRMQGDQAYVGATPSYIVWNLLSRYTKPGATVVDPFCGSGTTLDVAKDLGRDGVGFDLAPSRPDIRQADARKIPLPDRSADFVFMDPPYGDHIRYSDHPDCIGKLSSLETGFFQAMDKAFSEGTRLLRPGAHLAVYVCDFFNVRKGFSPVGFRLFSLLEKRLEAVEIVSVVRHNKDLLKGNYRKAAVEQNFYLRGFNYLLIMKRPRL
ncbi:MAG: DNA methylase [Spirochaetes bacterium]|nr:DNA methylase [Spirochaetota bacterium]